MGYGGGDGETDATVIVGIIWLLDGRQGSGREVGEGFDGGERGRGAGVGSYGAGTDGPLHLSGGDAGDMRMTVL